MDKKLFSRFVVREINARQDFYKKLYENNVFMEQIFTALLLIQDVIKMGGKLLICGNGGLAAESQHFAGELVCAFKKNRRALPAIALTTDSSIMTAYSNDVDFHSVFSRQIEALCKPEDLVIGMTTSSVDYQKKHSVNIFRAFLEAKKIGARSLGIFSGKTEMIMFNDLLTSSIIVPSVDTAMIQEVQLFIIHSLSALLEMELPEKTG